jgi:transcriptional regulator with XRE-family HTH domain
MLTTTRAKLRNRCRQARLERGLSLKEVARRSGMSRVTLRSIERDDGHEPTDASKRRLSEVLGQSVNALFWWD